MLHVPFSELRSYDQHHTKIYYNYNEYTFKCKDSIDAERAVELSTLQNI